MKQILYNIDGKTPFITIVHWGYVSDITAGELPVLSEFNPESNEGFLISPKQVANYNFGFDKIIDTDFTKYANDLENKWVMYVYEIQHRNE